MHWLVHGPAQAVLSLWVCSIRSGVAAVRYRHMDMISQDAVSCGAHEVRKQAETEGGCCFRPLYLGRCAGGRHSIWHVAGLHSVAGCLAGC